MGKIKAWTDHIITHFWYCSNVCKLTPTTSDEEALKVMKVCHLLEYKFTFFTYVLAIKTLLVCIVI